MDPAVMDSVTAMDTITVILTVTTRTIRTGVVQVMGTVTGMVMGMVMATAMAIRISLRQPPLRITRS